MIPMKFGSPLSLRLTQDEADPQRGLVAYPELPSNDAIELTLSFRAG